MLKAIIIEDEPNAREVLEFMCSKYCKTEIIGTATNVSDAMSLLSNNTPDILFLDISLPDGSGFDILTKLGEIDYSVIFTTAYHEFAIEAIRMKAVDYLIKPIDIEELKNAVKRAEDHKEQNSKLQNMHQMVNAIERNKPAVKFPINDGREIIYSDINEIVRFQASRRYTNIFLSSSRKYTITRNLGDFESELIKYGFLRVHKSHIVNPYHIVAYEKTNGGCLRLSDNSVVEISRRKKDEVKMMLKLLSH